MSPDDIEVIDLREQVDSPDRPRGATRSRRPARRGLRSWWLRAVIAVMALGLLGWALTAYAVVMGVRSDLFAARDDLEAVEAAVGDADLPAATDRLRAARDGVADVPQRLDGIAVAPVRLLPTWDRTIDAVSVIARAAGLAAEAGILVTDAASVDPDGLGALAPVDGRVPLEAFDALAPVLGEASSLLREAERLVQDVPREGIDSRVVEARDTFAEVLGTTGVHLQLVAATVDVLPAMFGADQPRRYVVVAANPTESRGAGGFFGAYTVMTADDGELSFSDVQPTEDLPVVPRGTIPWPDDSLGARYDAYGGSGVFRNINMTPDFSVAATAVENLYQEITGSQVDGVIAVNPFAFESLLEIAGPVEVPGYGPVEADEVVEFVSYDAYSAITDSDERKSLIGYVASAALQGFLANPGGVSAQQVLGALGDMVADGSLMVHAADAEAQAKLEALGVAGRLGSNAGGDLVAVFLNSGSPSKVDYWLQRTFHYDAVLGPDGIAAGVLTAGFANSAPTTGEVAYMIGTGVPDPIDPGDVLSLVSVYCPPGCDIHEIPDDGFAGLETQTGEELGFGVTSTWMHLPSGQERQMAWSYTTPGAWENVGADRVYRLHYDHQVSILPTELHIRVEIPSGFEVESLPDGAVQDGEHVQLDAVVMRDLDLELVFTPAA